MRLIVGIDPGISVGIAILDLYGNVLAVMSRKGMSRNDIVKTITKFGHPLIVASDVVPMPRTVERIAKTFRAMTYFPDELLHISEKKNLIKDYFTTSKQEHEVDALAAAIKAWKKHRSFFLKTKEELEKLGIPEIFEEVISKLIRGDVGNIENAVIEVLNEKARYG